MPDRVPPRGTSAGGRDEVAGSIQSGVSPSGNARVAAGALRERSKREVVRPEPGLPLASAVDSGSGDAVASELGVVASVWLRTRVSPAVLAVRSAAA